MRHVVCCSITGTPPCGCAGGGGWAETVDKCPNQGGVCDAYMEISTDSHGCAVLVMNTSKCCGCPPPKDSGADVTDSATSDVTAE